MTKKAKSIKEISRKNKPKKVGLTKLKEYKYNKFLVYLSIGVSLSTVLILLIDKGIFINKKNEWNFSNYTVAIVIIVFSVLLVFMVFNIFLDKVFINNYSKRSFERDEIIEVFKALEKDNKYKTTKLDEYISELKQITGNLDKSPIENLISWKNSEKIELSAKKVWAISYNLKWLTKKRIKSIIEELAKPENSDREYHFIILKKQDSYPRINLVKKMKREFSEKYKNDNGKEFHFGQRFFILYDSTDIIVPLPNDVAIYQGFPDKGNFSNEYVVINTKEFHDENYNLEENYDLKFEDNEQISRVKKWFEDKWNELYKKYEKERKKEK